MADARRAAAEIAAACLSLLLRIVVKGTPWGLPTLLLLAVGWSAYLGVRLLRNPPLWEAWGIRPPTWKRALLLHGGATLAAVALVAAAALLLGFWPPRSPAPASLLLYPAWALAQEFALQNVMAANLTALGLRPHAVVAVSAGLFGAAHLPNLPLAALALVGGLLWCILWQRARNLWTLTLCHAVVGWAAVAFFLHGDPAGEFLGAL
ncbi:MAG: CPBP family intramembrane metalloprotease [Halobacteriales archaeon]|nr:CPBP family intramembrane metalloprotease [Halobacteriales archaeon]